MVVKTKYAKGFETLEKEIDTKDLSITGKIPDWLNGSLIRTGPAKFEAGRKQLNHWFDGFAMLHQFNFDKGVVSYRNKFIESRSYLGMREKGRLTKGEFATDPCQSIFQYFFSLFAPGKPTDNANINTGKIGESFVSMTETTMPVEFNRHTLETIGHIDFEDEEKGGILTVAHPHYDEQKNLYSYLLEFGYLSRYKLYKQDYGSMERKVFASIPSKEPAYIHSFGSTENYIILVEFPLVVNPLKLKFSRKPLITNYRWKPELGSRFHIVDKESGKLVSTLKSKAFFAFHHINAFEKDEEIILDIVAYEDSSIIDDLYLNKLRTEKTDSTANLRRFHLNPQKETIKEEMLSETSIELPRINNSKYGTPYKIIFAAANTIPGNFIDSLWKRNLQSGEESLWMEENTYPGEPVFIPDPNAKEEDDGLILSVTLDAERETSFLLILDARSFKEVARVKVPHHIPFGFHGNFFAEETAEG